MYGARGDSEVGTELGVAQGVVLRPPGRVVPRPPLGALVGSVVPRRAHAVTHRARRGSEAGNGGKARLRRHVIAKEGKAGNRRSCHAEQGTPRHAGLSALCARRSVASCTVPGMTTPSSHADSARAMLKAVQAARIELDRTYEHRAHDVRRIAQINAQIREGLRVAQVEATLDNGEALREIAGVLRDSRGAVELVRDDSLRTFSGEPA